MNLCAQSGHFDTLFGLAERYSGKSGVERSENEAYHGWKAAHDGRGSLHMGNLGYNGNVLRVVRALIAAHKANIDLSFEKAAVIDLAGQDAEDLVEKESGSCGD